MKTAVSEDLAFPRATNRPGDPWLPSIRRRVLRGESSGLGLDILGNGPHSAGGPKGRHTTRDPLAECLAFAARWEAPMLAVTDDPDGLDACAGPGDQPAPAF